MAHAVEIKFGGEVGDGFEFLDVEISAKIVAEGASKAEEVGEGETFFEDFILDANKDFLL